MGFSPMRGPIRTYNLCFLGFGNVNRTLVRLLADRAAELRDRHGIDFRITGVASRRLGWIADPNGFDPTAVSDAVCGAGTPARERPEANPNLRASLTAATNVRDWLSAAQADVLFEATSLNVKDGEPAVDHIRAALEHGAHAITANKGPIVHAYRELRDLAAKQRQALPLRIHGHGRRPHLLSVRPAPRDPPARLSRNPQLDHQRDSERDGSKASPSTRR